MCCVFVGHYEHSELWAFDLKTHEWSCLWEETEVKQGVKLHAPDNRSGSAGWIWQDYFYTFSGACVNKLCHNGRHEDFAELWRFDLNTNTWELVHGDGAVPAARAEMGVAVSDKGTIYLVGGYTSACHYVDVGCGCEGCTACGGGRPRMDATAYLNEVLEFSPATGWWRNLRVAGSMQGPLGFDRAGAAAAWVDGVLYSFGGYAGEDNECPEVKRIK